MGAWKLRAIVYGMLAVVSALVLWQSGAVADDDPEGRVLQGHLSNGQMMSVVLSDDRVTMLRFERLGEVCDGRWWFRWTAWANKPGVAWHQGVDQLGVRQRAVPPPRGVPPRSFEAWAIDYDLQAWVSDGGKRMNGVVWYSARRGKRSCHSGPQRFTARANP